MHTVWNRFANTPPVAAGWQRGAGKDENMRNLSLLSLIAALVIVGFVLKRQLSVTQIPASTRGTTSSTGDTPATASGNDQRAPVTEQIRDSLDQLVHERGQQLQELESTSND